MVITSPLRLEAIMSTISSSVPCEEAIESNENVTVIPDNERWLHEPQAAADFERGLAWAVANPRVTDNAQELLDKWNEEFR